MTTVLQSFMDFLRKHDLTADCKLSSLFLALLLLFISTSNYKNSNIRKLTSHPNVQENANRIHSFF